MTRLLTCGYETGDINEAGISTIGANMTLTLVNTVPAPRAGAYCLKVAPTATQFGNGAYKTLSLGGAKTDVWLRFAFYAHGIASTAELGIAAWYDSTGSIQSGLSYTGSDGLLRVYRGSVGSTILGAASTALAQDGWHVIEWRQQMTSATVGITEVWLDGNRVINFSGDNVNTTNVNVQTLLLGNLSTSAVINPAGAYLAYDDIAVNDTAGTLNNGRAGDGRVVLLSPNGAGSSTQWVRGGTDTGANFSQVSELPPSMAQYVGSPTVGNRDLYALQDLAVAVQSINVVEAVLLAQNSDAGGGSIAPTIRSGATTNESGSIGLSTSAAYVIGRWETDPNTSAAWTAAGVNAAEVGATVR